jgi:biotin carboxyl carrier protein
MTFEEIEAVVRRLDGRGVATADIRIGPARLKLRFAAEERPEPVLAEPPPALATAPSPGRFRGMHPLEAAPRFAEGDRIGKGETIAYVEANGLLLPVVATADLTLGRALANDGEAVGWGTPLYETR